MTKKRYIPLIAALVMVLGVLIEDLKVLQLIGGIVVVSSASYLLITENFINQDRKTIVKNALLCLITAILFIGLIVVVEML